MCFALGESIQKQEKCSGLRITAFGLGESQFTPRAVNYHYNLFKGEKGLWGRKETFMKCHTVTLGGLPDVRGLPMYHHEIGRAHV